MEDEQLSQDDADFLAAFEQDGMPVEEEPAAEEQVTEEDVVSGEEESPAEAPAMAEQAPSDGEDEPTDPAEVQRAKSWEGRLRAREEALRAREEALKAMETKQPQAEAPAAEEPSQAEVEKAIESVEGLEDDEAMRALAEDFGEDFAKTLGKIIESRAAKIAEKAIGERVGKMDQTVQEIISGLQSDKARNHFEAIQESHPDFLEIASSEDLKKYVESLPPDEAKKAQSVIDGGSSRQVVKLLDNFKKAQSKPAQAEDDPAMVAAEGVRSRGGLRLPEKPQISSDYAEAWDQF